MLKIATQSPRMGTWQMGMVVTLVSAGIATTVAAVATIEVRAVTAIKTGHCDLALLNMISTGRRVTIALPSYIKVQPGANEKKLFLLKSSCDR
jgi:hypothetical protein